jgi:hypothetical protein
MLWGRVTRFSLNDENGWRSVIIQYLANWRLFFCHFHEVPSPIKTRNWRIWIGCSLLASSYCAKWVSWDSSTLCIGFYWNSPGLDSEIDYHSHKCLFQGPQTASLPFVWIKFTIDANRIWSFLRIVPSINNNSKQCWNSWFEMFFNVWITFVNHIWIKFTIVAHWIISVLRIITSINCDSKRGWDSWFWMFFMV